MTRGDWAHAPGDVLHEGADVVPCLVRHERSILDAREIEQATHQAVEPHGLVLDRGRELVALALRPVDVALSKASRRRKDRRERRPELVRYGVEQLRLEIVRAAEDLGLRRLLAKSRALDR